MTDILSDEFLVKGNLNLYHQELTKINDGKYLARDKIGDGLSLNESGVLSVTGGGGSSDYTLPTASIETLGGVKVDGTTINVDSNGVISAIDKFQTMLDMAYLSASSINLQLGSNYYLYKYQYILITVYTVYITADNINETTRHCSGGASVLFNIGNSNFQYNRNHFLTNVGNIPIFILFNSDGYSIKVDSVDDNVRFSGMTIKGLLK